MRTLPILFVSLSLIGCAGSLTIPERVYRHTDASLSCSDIEREATSLMQGIEELGESISSDRVKNLSVWLAGQLLLFPMLAMDVSGNKQLQRTSVLRRLERLKDLAEDKMCT